MLENLEYSCTIVTRPEMVCVQAHFKSFVVILHLDYLIIFAKRREVIKVREDGRKAWKSAWPQRPLFVSIWWWLISPFRNLGSCLHTRRRGRGHVLKLIVKPWPHLLGILDHLLANLVKILPVWREERISPEMVSQGDRYPVTLAITPNVVLIVSIAGAIHLYFPLSCRTRCHFSWCNDFVRMILL